MRRLCALLASVTLLAAVSSVPASARIAATSHLPSSDTSAMSPVPTKYVYTCLWQGQPVALTRVRQRRVPRLADAKRA
jgi:hypothetical protein